MANQNNKGPPTRPRPRRNGLTREQKFAVGSVLLVELFERLTFYSVTGNLVLFCTSALNYSSDEASIVAFVFAGTAYLFPMLGGFVADVWLGKFKTIVVSCMIYIYGVATLVGAAWIRLKVDWYEQDIHFGLERRKNYFFGGLVFIAVGSGGFKANIAPFGAQQVEDLRKDAVKSFFSWYFWFTNVGAFIALSGVTYVQQEIGFVCGFLIPLISIILALIIFMAAHSKYVYKYTPHSGSIIRPAIGVCVQSCSGCRRHTFSRAGRENGGLYDKQMVDAVKVIVRALPVFGLFMVYFAVHGQMSTSLFLQSERMDVSIGNTKLPAAASYMFNTLIILILIPIMDLGVYPRLAKIGRSPTTLQRIGIGMVLAALAMFYAGVIEISRKNDIAKHGYIEQTLSDVKFNASKISMFAQVPEFAFIGSSEVFASISGIEFAYTQAPPFMQSLTMGLYLLIHGLAFYMSSVIVAVVKLRQKDDSSDWYPEEPNNGQLENYLFFLAALTILNLILLIVLARWYESKQVSDNEEPELEVDPAVEYDNRACVRERSLSVAESTAL